MINLLFLFIFFFLITDNLNASNKDKVLNKFNKIENISFDFIQTIKDKSEKGNCIIYIRIKTVLNNIIKKLTKESI